MNYLYYLKFIFFFNLKIMTTLNDGNNQKGAIAMDLKEKIQQFKINRNSNDKKENDEFSEFEINRDMLENYKKSKLKFK